MLINKGNGLLKETFNNEFIADEFAEFIDEIFLINKIDIDKKAEFMKNYADVLKEHKRPDVEYFTPSSISSCNLSLYAKLKGYEKDDDNAKPHQRRWQDIGNAVGDMLQEKILNAESFIDEPKFKFKKDINGNPIFEEFSSKLINIDDINIFGQCDGIVEYKNKDFILEIKSKQTTYSTTSYNAMKTAKKEHIQQCVMYSLMYGIDTCIICYLNTSKKGWNVDEKNIKKYPDVRVFVVEITEEMKADVINKLKYIKKCVVENNPPSLDFDCWDFNNYKNACIEIMRDTNNNVLEKSFEKYRELSSQKNPLYIKRSIDNAYKEVIRKCCMLD